MRLTLIGTVLGVLAAAAALGVPLELPDSLSSFWASLSPKWHLVGIASDLVQAYAILAGLVVQVITLVALVFDPNGMDARKVRRVIAGLDRMQQQFLGLFAIYIATLACCLGAKVSITVEKPPDTPLPGLWLAATAFMVLFSVARTAEMGRSILSVQRLRSRMLLLQSRASSGSPPPELPIEPDPTPEAYGTKVQAINGRR